MQVPNKSLLVTHTSCEIDNIIICGGSEKLSYLPMDTQLLSQGSFWIQGY